MYIFLLQFITAGSEMSALPNPPGDDLSLPAQYAEKLFLHLDRDVYMVGENIRFGITSHVDNSPTVDILSTLVYLELYTYSAAFSIKQKLLLKNTKTTGLLEIPDDFPTGRYFIRVYTNFQKNYLPQDLTYTEILIINPDKPMGSAQQNKSMEVFFRNGVPICGFQTEGAIQMEFDTKNIVGAHLITEDHVRISAIELIGRHHGIFNFTPEAGKKLNIIFHFEDGDSLLFPIGPFRSSGWVILAQQMGSGFKINYACVNNPAEDSIFLLIKDQNLDLIRYESIKPTDNQGEYVVTLPPEAGITYYCILLGAGKEMLACTRFTLAGQNEPALQANTDRKEYQPGENVFLTIRSENTASDSISSMSVSVHMGQGKTDANPIGMQRIKDIIFDQSISNDSANMSERLNINKTIPISKLPEIREVSLTGFVRNRETNEPVGNCRVYLSVLGDQPQIHAYETQEDGTFIFSLNSFTGNKKLFLATEPRSDVHLDISINTDFLAPYIPDYAEKYFSRDEHHLYEKMFINKQLSDRFLQEEKRSDVSRFVTQSIFTAVDHTVDLDDFIELSSFEEVFKEIVPGVFLFKKKDAISFQIQHPENARMFMKPLVLMDNAPIFALEQLLRVPPSVIDRIDIIYREYQLGSYTIPGIIHIVTKTPQFENINFPEGCLFFDYQTVSPRIHGGTNSYEAQHYCNMTAPCFSNLLFWNPCLNMEPAGKEIEINFAAGDNEAVYEVEIYATTLTGKRIQARNSFRVIK
jgi:hypothetical protein